MINIMIVHFIMYAIQNLPGITVDPEGIVYLRGSDKVSILMDGKQSGLTGYGNQKGLDNIPAANIINAFSGTSIYLYLQSFRSECNSGKIIT